MDSPWLVKLDQTLSSYSIIATLLVVVLLIGVLERLGVIGWALALFGRVTRWGISSGFHVWERWLSWANWWVYLILTFAVTTLGALAASSVPVVALICAAISLSMGVSTCLAYMFIDIERYEVERGRKAVYNPTKGQELAPNVARYRHRAGVMLMVAAALGVIGGFILLNQGAYETVGRSWYIVDTDSRPGFVDFGSYAVINLLSLVDVLNLADSQRLLHATFVHKGAWPAGVMLAAFRSFFTLILLQQVFASVRQGRLLSETIADFWSPHEPIHDRARNALPQFGAAAIGPVLVSLREMTALTKEQRDQLPIILAAIGPSTIHNLIQHLNDSHDHVRAIAAGTLGQLRAQEALPAVAALLDDPSGIVRVSAVEAIGLMAGVWAKTERSRLIRMPRRSAGRFKFLWWRQPVQTINTTEFAIEVLRRVLKDDLAAVRSQAAASLGQAGAAATDEAPALAELLNDADESVRCQAAESLGQISGPPELLLPALNDPAAPVRSAAAMGLKLLGRRAVCAVPRLIELLQDREEAVRTAASEALNATGPLDDGSTTQLAKGLSSPDTTVRAQAAEALGSIDASAEHAAPPLIEALEDGNDVVRAKAVEALGKIGEAAADVAVPGLVRALRDRDSWVSALAAEALGEMGVSVGVVPSLIRALSHVNPQVRANSAEALGKLGSVAGQARTALEVAAADKDGVVRARAVCALGALGPPPPSSVSLIRGAITDADPVVRAAAASAAGAWEQPPDELLNDLLPLLRDPNDEVKIQVCEILSKWPGASLSVVEGLCSALAEDDSDWVQASASQALARIGPIAKSSGPALVKAAQTGEVGVREQAMRALVMIQPPEAAEAFAAGLADPVADVRLIASAGWMKAAEVPASAGPALFDALRDPEPQVRANAAHALARLEVLPIGAMAALRECAGDSNDAIRLNASLALRLAPSDETADLMDHLLDDPNVRVRLVAAGYVLSTDPASTRAAAVVTAAADDPSPRVQQAIEELLPLIQTGPDVAVETTK